MSDASPFSALAQRLVHDPVGERHDEPCLLRKWDELRGRHELAIALPAHQCFERDDGSAAHVQQRLVVQSQLVPVERVTEVAKGSQPCVAVT